MNGREEFLELIERVRNGDREAAGILWLQNQPQLLRRVRRNLRRVGRAGRNLTDDCLQSAARVFIDRCYQGKLDQHLQKMTSPADLTGLLLEIAGKRVIDWARRERAQRRNPASQPPERIEECRSWDPGRPAASVVQSRGANEPIANEPTPSTDLAINELVEKYLPRFSDEERQIGDLYHSGKSWAEVAELLGIESAEAARKRYARAVTRIRRSVENSDL